MAPTKGKRKPTPRWTEAEVAELRRLVETMPTVSAAMQKFAKDTNRSVSTVTAKWYKESRRTGATSAASSGVPAVRNLGTDALIALHSATKAEITRRIEELQRADLS